MRRTAASLLALLTLAAARPEPQLPRISSMMIEVSIVNVDVVVTDRQGNRVHGLTKDDFVVLEDGKAQPITNFTEYERRAGSLTRPLGGLESPPYVADTEPPARPRTVVVFVDQMHIAPFKADPVFAAMKELLHGVVRKGDRTTIIWWDGEPITRLEPTDDVAAIDRTLDDLAARSVGVSGDPLGDVRRQATEQNDFASRVMSSARERGYSVDRAAFVPLDAYAAAIWARNEQRRKIASLNSLMTGFAGNEGRKMLLLASHRMSLVAGEEFFLSAGNSYPLPQHITAEFTMQPQLTSLVRTANATGFTLYPIYPEGMGTLGLASAADVAPAFRVAEDVSLVGGPVGAAIDQHIVSNEIGALGQIAKNTGGLMAWSAKDIVETLPKVQEDLESYYSLAYRATRQNEDRVRRIAVRAKNPDYRIRTRREVVEKSDRSKMEDRVVATLFEPPSMAQQIAVRVDVGKARRAGRDRYEVPLIIRFPASELMTVPEQRGAGGGFSVYLAWGGILGEVSDVTTRIQPFTARDLADAQRGDFTYDFTLLTDKRTDRVAIGVMDELSREYGVARVELPARD
jgi:VWFA-related protein